MEKTLGLNAEQTEAVETINGPLLVVAGAGSGKTRVVTYRIVRLLQKGIPPYRILGLTFTNKAANEMKERVRKLTNNQVLITTFHSLGARILRESIQTLGYPQDFTIYDEEDSEKLLRSCLHDIFLEDKKSDFKVLRALISKAKNDFAPLEQIDTQGLSPYLEKLFPSLYQAYQTRLKEAQAVDFDDLLYLPVRLFHEHPEILEMYQNRWTHLLIDEYQDTNAAQYQMVKCLAAKSHNICVVGDPDQSIYSWRGASVKNILNFEKDYPEAKVIRLEQNYRSHNNILKAANALIENNENRFHKHLWSDLGEGEKIKLFVAENEQEEAEFVVDKAVQHHLKESISLNDMVIFYRANSQSRVFEDYLLFKKVPYTIVGGISFYQRREIKDILAFLRMAMTSADIIAFERTINLPKRGFGDATLEKLRSGALQSQMPIYAFLKSLVDETKGSRAVKLSEKQKKQLVNYLDCIDKLKSIAQSGTLQTLVRAAIEQTGYLNVLREDPDSFEDRKENVEELISKAAEWETERKDPTLTSFLEELSLKSQLDETEGITDRLKLMTLHNGKGLEFEVTFLVGFEEDLLPHINSKGNPDSLEEERRLCYVGVTRAKKILYLTYARARLMWGMLRNPHPSRFLREIPYELRERVTRTYAW